MVDVRIWKLDNDDGVLKVENQTSSF